MVKPFNLSAARPGPTQEQPARSVNITPVCLLSTYSYVPLPFVHPLLLIHQASLGRTYCTRNKPFTLPVSPRVPSVVQTHPLFPHPAIAATTTKHHRPNSTTNDPMCHTTHRIGRCKHAISSSTKPCQARTRGYGSCTNPPGKTVSEVKVDRPCEECIAKMPRRGAVGGSDERDGGKN